MFQPFKFVGKGPTLLKRFSFAKADRIRTSTEYRMLSKKGKRHFSDHFIFIYRKTHLSSSRLGITISKKVGKAVIRNRIKRTIREYFRLNRGLLPGRMDINIIARQSSGRVEVADIRRGLGSWFEAFAGNADRGYYE